jgi:hypothetical protein
MCSKSRQLDFLEFPNLSLRVTTARYRPYGFLGEPHAEPTGRSEVHATPVIATAVVNVLFRFHKFQRPRAAQQCVPDHPP